MIKGDYVYYRDNRYEYILEIKGDIDFHTSVDVYIKILKCSKSDFSGGCYWWNLSHLVQDCKNMRVLSEVEALAMVL